MGRIDTLATLTTAKSISATDGFYYATFSNDQLKDVTPLVSALKRECPLSVTFVNADAAQNRVEVVFNAAALRTGRTPFLKATADYLAFKAQPQPVT